MNTHTATPWAWRGHADLNGLCHINAENKTIVQVWDFPEAEANAAFICRAVNSHEALIESLKHCVNALEYWFDRHDDTEGLNSPLLTHAREALKLAEGRE